MYVVEDANTPSTVNTRVSHTPDKASNPHAIRPQTPLKISVKRNEEGDSVPTLSWPQTPEGRTTKGPYNTQPHAKEPGAHSPASLWPKQAETTL